MRLFLATMLAALAAPLCASSFEYNSLKNSIRQKQQIESQRIDQSRRATEKEQSVSCLLLKVGFIDTTLESLEGVEKKDELRCVLEERGNSIFRLEGLPSNFLADNEESIKSAETVMTVFYPKEIGDIAAQGASKKFILRIPSNSTIDLQPATQERRGALSRGRNLVQTEGNSTVLVIRVIDVTGAAPTKTAEELSDDIFGTLGDENNLRSQYSACSGGKLNFVPGEGANVVNGVAEVTLSQNVSGQSFFTVESWVSLTAPLQLGQNLSDWTHVMYVFPDTVEGEYIGYAYYNWYLSLFFDTYTSDLLVLMHEIGHNLDQQHSGEEFDPYGDGTCMMGAHVFADDAPRMCFNGAKSWHFGWYSERHITIDIDTMPWHGKLVGIDDYLNDHMGESDQKVIAKIKSTTNASLYLMYNRAKGVNEQVYTMGDMVTVVEQNGKNAKSVLLGGVTEQTEEFRFLRWSGENDLVIQVCERVWGDPDYATTLVFVDYQATNVSCDQLTPALPGTSPTSPPSTLTATSPTTVPTSPPTVVPTPSPASDAPTVSPATDAPTVSPATDASTASPATDAPTASPATDAATASLATVAPTASPATAKLEQDIKPVTVTFPVASGNDDYRELKSGTMRRADKAHELFCGDDWNLHAYRFSPNDRNRIPAGALVESAIFLIYPDDDQSLLANPIFGKAVGNNVGYARGFRKIDFYISNLRKTRTSVTIRPSLKKWRPNRYQKLTNVARIVQEIIDRKDYSAGNPIEIILVGNDSSSCRKIKTTNGGKRPKLRVTYNPKSAPKEIVLQISNGKDDYRESASGNIGTGASTQQLWSSTYPREAIRFRNVSVPQGATILEARLEVMAKNQRTVARNVSGIVQAENVGNSPPFKAGAFQLANAPKTTASVEITNLPTWTVDEYNSLGDVTPVVQEIVNREDYSAGNAIKLILLNNNSPANRVARTFESGAGAKLIIRYRDQF